MTERFFRERTASDFASQIAATHNLAETIQAENKPPEWGRFSGPFKHPDEVTTDTLVVAFGAAGNLIVPLVGSALGVQAGFLMTEIGTLFFADCDGPVAAGKAPSLTKSMLPDRSSLST